MKKFLVLGMGGTIAGLARQPADAVNYQAAQLGVGDLLSGLQSSPAWGSDVEWAHEQVAQVNSKDMSFDLLELLTRRVALALADPAVQGVVITHGTDTLEESAYWLHLRLSASLQAAKPVVLTCAMRPANAPDADGPGNLLDAMKQAQDPNLKGVWVQCAGELLPGWAVQKIHSQRLNAFDASDAQIQLNTAQTAGNFAHLVLSASTQWPWVEVIRSHSGASGRVVEALLQSGVQGLVVAGTGNGTLHQDLESALIQAQTQGTPVLRSTRCTWGGVLSRLDDQLPHAQDLSPAKARLHMVLSLLESATRPTTLS
jgi:L-asparaginase